MSNYIECQHFINFVNTAKANEFFKYHEGVNASETILSNELRKLAWDFACKGKVYLVQARIGLKFQYIAIKASSPAFNSLVPYIRERESGHTNHLRTYTPRKVKSTLAGAYNG